MSNDTDNTNLDNNTNEAVVSDKDISNTKTQVNKYRALLSEDYSINNTNVNKITYRISLPSKPIMEFNNILNNYNRENIDLDKDELKEWKTTVEDSVDLYTIGGLYQDRFSDDKSLFKQGIDINNELKSMSDLKFKKVDGEIKGEIAVLKVSKLLGLGDVVNIPLPHSGIWITIKPPTERDLIDFYNNIFKEKISLGRATFGLTLTNFSVYIQNKLFEFIAKHIHSINYSDINKDNLANYILIHDLPIIAWGFAYAMYPNGFDYQRACVEDIEKCSYVAKATINLCKLLWIDNNSLSDVQKNILYENRPNKLTIESYRKYISESTRVSGFEFTVKDNIKIKLKIPTVAEYTSDGLNWVNKINSKIDSLITDESDEEARKDLLNSYVKSSILRQFSHFIDYIEIDENVVTDRETINSILEVFSSDDDIRNIITENILKYKSNSTIALVGIPEYKCPNCGAGQNKEPVNDNFINVIPLDVLNVFFILVTLRIGKILERDI